MPRILVAALALVVIGSVAVVTFQAGLENAGQDITITNETFTPAAGSVTQLNESGRTGAYYSNQTTVYDENGTVMDRGDDYQWFTSNGTLRTVTSGGLDGDADATITYAFQQTTAEQRQLADLLSAVPTIVGYAAPFLLLLFLIRFLVG